LAGVSNLIMSRTISIFLDEKIDFDALIKSLDSHTFLKLAKVKDDGEIFYQASLLGIEIIVFGSHDLINDNGIEFEKYKYEIDFQVTLFKDYDTANDLLHSIVDFIAEAISKEVSNDYIVIDDFQRIFKRH